MSFVGEEEFFPPILRKSGKKGKGNQRKNKKKRANVFYCDIFVNEDDWLIFCLHFDSSCHDLEKKFFFLSLDKQR